MAGKGLSTEFRIVLACVVLIPVGIDQLCGLAATHIRQAKALASQKKTFVGWRREIIPGIQVTLELPATARGVILKPEGEEKLNIGHAERFEGSTPEYGYEMARYQLTGRKAFDAEDHFKKVIAAWKTADGITDFKGSTASPIIWGGCKSYLLNASFTGNGIPITLHEIVRVGKNEWFYLQGWSYKSSQKEGEAAWNRMLRTIRFGDASAMGSSKTLVQ